MKTIRTLTTLAIALCAAAFTQTASAQETTEVNRAGGEIGGVLGFGTHTGYGFGLGVEGGYTLPMHLYIGGNFTYFTGSDGVHAFLFEPQVGYAIAVSDRVPILVRPYIGLGYESVSVSSATVCVPNFGCETASGSGGGGAFLISPGVVGTYFFTPHWYAGLDLRFDIGTGTYGNAVFSPFATGGYKF